MYDLTIGQFVSDDPIDFDAGDPNVRRYVGNSPTNATDPSELAELPSPRTTPYWDGKDIAQRIWKPEREQYPNDPP